MKNGRLSEIRADFLLLTVSVAWGVTFLMVQEAIDTTPVYAFLFYRFALASIVMFFIAYKYLKEIDKRTILSGILLGTFLFLGFATQTFGLLYTQSSIVAFITGLNVIAVPFLAYVIFKDVVRKNVFIAALVAICGLYLLTMSGTLSIGKGEILTLACAFLFGAHIVYTGKYSKEYNVYLLVFVQLLTITFYSLAFSLMFDDVTFAIEFDSPFYKAVIVTALFATVYAFLIQTYMQQFTTATKTAIIFTMEPVSAAFYGYYVGGEILTSIQIIGAVLIIVATLIAELRLKNAK